MIYKQITDYCTGDNVVTKDEIKALQLEAAEILKTLKNDESSGKLPIISLARRTDDLPEIEEFAANIRKNFDNLVVLGTGGSSLCGHAVAGFMQNEFTKNSPKLIFMQNIDPKTFADFFATINLKRTAFLAISKSGVSVETLMQLLLCLEQAKNLDIKHHFFAITEPGNNILRNIAAKHGIKVYDHDAGVGGRFSILSLVGLMPGVIAGIDAKQFRTGAWEFFDKHAGLAAEAAAIHVALMRKGIWQNVLMTYPDRLEHFNIWHRQIWAESLGKNGAGSTPIKATGTLDQHSQMQLYLDGRKDKFFSFIILDHQDKLSIGNDINPELAYLNGKTLGDLINAEQRATIETLCNRKRPVRVICLQTLTAETFGMLTMHLMLETIITAHLLGVNPYDQPAVEAGKVLTRKIMSGIL